MAGLLAQKVAAKALVHSGVVASLAPDADTPASLPPGRVLPAAASAALLRSKAASFACTSIGRRARWR